MKNTAVLLLAVLSLQSLAHAAPLRCEQIFFAELSRPSFSRSTKVLLYSENISVTKIEVQYTDREVFNPYVREVITDPDVVKQVARTLRRAPLPSVQSSPGPEDRPERPQWDALV